MVKQLGRMGLGFLVLLTIIADVVMLVWSLNQDASLESWQSWVALSYLILAGVGFVAGVSWVFGKLIEAFRS